MSPVVWQQPLLILAELARRGVVPHGLVTDSRKVRAGWVFAAYPGERLDGRRFIAQAVAAGAAAVLCEVADGWNEPLPSAIVILPVAGLKFMISELADAMFGHPSQALRVIGVTGTNGKTSCAHWLAQTLAAAGTPAAVMGTLGNGVLPDLEPADNTTGDAALLQQQLAQYRAQGVRAVAMEVSSIGLEQRRVEAVRFDTALLTNLSRDHLDVHGDMDRYAAAKARLFSWPGLRCAVINADDAFGATLLRGGGAQADAVMGYGFGAAEVRGRSLTLSAAGLDMQVDTPWGGVRIVSHMLGHFNASNLLGVLGVLLAGGMDREQAAGLLQQLKPPAGRMQTLGGGARPLVVVDYAHTPDALEKVLTSLRELAPAARLLCVFGCGGERDAGKRPLMGAIVSRLADVAVVTSDNPRGEAPERILADIRAGMDGREQVEADRGRAIEIALEQSRPGDIVLVAGKGHEAYQEIAGVRHPFSDAAVVMHWLEARTWA